jgi:hypothetical protein
LGAEAGRQTWSNLVLAYLLDTQAGRPLVQIQDHRFPKAATGITWPRWVIHAYQTSLALNAAQLAFTEGPWLILGSLGGSPVATAGLGPEKMRSW